MKNKQASTTAEGMAVVRAIEAQKPEMERICYDPIARDLVNPMSVFFSKLIINSGLYDRFGAKGAIEFILVRERYIDDFLMNALQEGLDQVVILGAGFDTRAYRIPGIEKTRVFEVDHPATQEHKMKRLNRVIRPLPGHVTFVPVDFNTQTLAEVLQKSGYNQTGKTLFIWQGVVMYLTQEGVDNTLRFIAERSGAGSAVVFDYFYNETLRDMKMKNAQRVTKMMDETLMFGIDEGQLEPFLAQRGFEKIRNTTDGELEELYLTGPNANRSMTKGVAIASARVRK